MEQITKIRPAFDRVEEGYGIHCMQVFMVLKGKKGAVHFTWSTGIFLDETQERLARKGDLDWKNLSSSREHEHWFSIAKAQGYDVGYHSLEPMNEYEKERGPRKDCDWLDNRPCYGDGSAMRAEEWLKVLKKEGSDKIWEMLEAEYLELFGELQ